jgi:CRP-like cAMP-binding protein
MDFIRKHLELSAKLTDKDWKFFSSRLTRQEFPKKSLLIKTGQVENHLSFMEIGIVRFYIPKEEKNDFTFSFTFENNFTSAYESFLTRTVSAYAVETLTPTVLWRLTHADLQEIYAETKIGNTIGRLAAEGLYLETSKRELSLLNETAEQRYLNLFTEQPHLIRKIPLKYLASYIGITPQALSRIRKRIC